MERALILLAIAFLLAACSADGGAPGGAAHAGMPIRMQIGASPLP